MGDQGPLGRGVGGHNHARMRMSKGEENGSFLGLQMNELNEMNEKMSFKVYMKFADSVYMGEVFPNARHVFVRKSTGTEL